MNKKMTDKDRKMQITAETLGERIGAWLRRSSLSPGKTAHNIGSDPRAVKNWFAGENPPRLAEAIKLMAESYEFAEEINQIVKEIRLDR